MVGVGHGLLEQLADVLVVQRVDDVAPDAPTGDEPEMPQDPQLM
jgi:hypothetical protein